MLATEASETQGEGEAQVEVAVAQPTDEATGQQAPAAKKELQFATIGYVWFAGAHGKTDVIEPLPPVDLDLPFGKVLKAFKFAFMRAAEVKYDRFVALGDLTFIHLDARQGIGIRDPDFLEAELIEAGFGLREKLDAGSVLITRGEDGMSLFTAEGHTHFPTRARKVYDVTGAGDTVVATIATALAAKATLPEACVLANHAAGIVVAQLGTATAGAEDLIASLEDLPVG
jgi:hypothetical protein